MPDSFHSCGETSVKRGLPTLDADVQILIDRVGATLLSAQAITALQAADRRAATFLLRLADGRILKGRRLQQTNGAARIAELHSLLHDLPLNRIVDHCGSALLEEWVEGEPLSDAPPRESCFGACGEILARIHSVAAPLLNRTEPTPDSLVEECEQNLRELCDGGAISSVTVLELSGAIRQCAPAAMPSARIAHMDYCAENIIRTPQQNLILIDNANLTVATAEEDLARVWYRWPMSEVEWNWFARGYRRVRSPGVFFDGFLFWGTVVLARAARHLHTVRAPRVERPLQLLDELCALIRQGGRWPTNLRGAANTVSPAPCIAQSRVRMDSLPLEYQGDAIEVRCASPAPLRWLREFLTPAFEVSQHRDFDDRIDVVIDRGQYSSLLQSEPATARPAACFTLDGRFEEHLAWGHDDQLTVCDTLRRVVYRFSRDRRSIAIVAEEDGDGLRVAMLRIVRELATRRALMRGRLHLHGSAVSFDAGALLFCGQRRSGKTTLLIQTLRATRARYLTNDRAMLDVHDDVHASAMPTIVKLRADLVNRIPELRDGLLNSGFRRDRTFAEAAEYSRLAPVPLSRRSMPVDAVPGLSPQQLCALLNVDAVAAAPVVAIVFPQIDPDQIHTSWKPLPQHEAARRLIEEGQLRGGLSLVPQVFLPPGPVAGFEDRQAELCGAVASRVPAYSVRVGSDVFDDPGSIRRFLDSIDLS